MNLVVFSCDSRHAVYVKMALIDDTCWLVGGQNPMFSLLFSQPYIAEASVMAGSLDGSHDVIHKAHAVLGSGIKAAHLPVVEPCPRASYGMPCLPQADLQEGVSTWPGKPWSISTFSLLLAEIRSQLCSMHGRVWRCGHVGHSLQFTLSGPAKSYVYA